MFIQPPPPTIQMADCRQITWHDFRLPRQKATSQNQMEYDELDRALTIQIVDRFQSSFQNVEEFVAKIEWTNLFFNYIKSFWPFADALCIVGSAINGTCDKRSNLDLCLILPDPSGFLTTSKYFAINMLQILMTRLNYGESPMYDLTLIDTYVPVLRGKSRLTGLSVDIGCNNFEAVYCSNLLYFYAMADNRFSILSLVVKQWAEFNKLPLGNGYLTSYCWSLLVIFYLQQRTDQPPVLPCLQRQNPHFFSVKRTIQDLVRQKHAWPTPWTRSDNGKTAGVLLTEFFEFYTKKFCYITHAVSVRTGEALDRRLLELGSMSKSSLYIEDPYTGQNVAQSVNGGSLFKTITSMQIAHGYLKTTFRLECLFPED